MLQRNTQRAGNTWLSVPVRPERRRAAPKSKDNGAALRLRGLWPLRSARTEFADAFGIVLSLPTLRYAFAIPFRKIFMTDDNRREL